MALSSAARARLRAIAFRAIAILPLPLSGCDAATVDAVQEISAARGDCTAEGLRASDEECVRMMERYAAMGTELVHTYIGGLRSLDRALDRMPPVDFDTVGLGYALSPEFRGGDGGGAGSSPRLGPAARRDSRAVGVQDLAARGARSGYALSPGDRFDGPVGYGPPAYRDRSTARNERYGYGSPGQGQPGWLQREAAPPRTLRSDGQYGWFGPESSQFDRGYPTGRARVDEFQGTSAGGWIGRYDGFGQYGAGGRDGPRGGWNLPFDYGSGYGSRAAYESLFGYRAGSAYGSNYSYGPATRYDSSNRYGADRRASWESGYDSSAGYGSDYRQTAYGYDPRYGYMSDYRDRTAYGYDDRFGYGSDYQGASRYGSGRVFGYGSDYRDGPRYGSGRVFGYGSDYRYGPRYGYGTDYLTRPGYGYDSSFGYGSGYGIGPAYGYDSPLGYRWGDQYGYGPDDPYSGYPMGWSGGAAHGYGELDSGDTGWSDDPYRQPGYDQYVDPYRGENGERYGWGDGQDDGSIAGPGDPDPASTGGQEPTTIPARPAPHQPGILLPPEQRLRRPWLDD